MPHHLLMLVKRLKKNTPYNVEFIQELTGNSLDYEKKSEAFKITEF